MNPHPTIGFPPWSCQLYQKSLLPSYACSAASLPFPCAPHITLIKYIIKVSLPTGVFIVWKMLLVPPWRYWIRKYISLSLTPTLWSQPLSENLKCYLLQRVPPPEKLCQVPLSVISTPVVSPTLQESEGEEEKKERELSGYCCELTSYRVLPRALVRVQKRETHEVLHTKLWALSSLPESLSVAFQKKAWLSKTAYNS